MNVIGESPREEIYLDEGNVRITSEKLSLDGYVLVAAEQQWKKNAFGQRYHPDLMYYSSWAPHSKLILPLFLGGLLLLFLLGFIGLFLLIPALGIMFFGKASHKIAIYDLTNREAKKIWISEDWHLSKKVKVSLLKFGIRRQKNMSPC